ncbi:MAG: hypothetical protein R3B93_06245 [Bacteroidia bacterium]
MQFSIRPALVSTPVVRNMELAARYSKIQTPEGSEWEVNQNQWEVSFNYWIDWRTVVKVSYRSIQGEEGHGGEDEGGGHGIGEGNGHIHSLNMCGFKYLTTQNQLNS